MTTLDDLLAKAQPRTVTVPLCLRGDLLEEHEQAKAALAIAQAERRDDAVQVELAEAVVGIETDIAEATVDFVLRNIGRRAWSDLLGEHPPTDDQREVFGRRLDHNPDTFPYAAVAASCVAPDGVTAEKIRELEEVISSGQWDELWAACLTVNMGSLKVGESKAASDVLSRLRPRSAQPSA